MLPVSSQCIFLNGFETGAGVPFQERSGPIPLDVSHEDKLAMFDQKQSKSGIRILF